MVFTVINPATEETIKTYEEMSDEEAQSIITQTNEAFNDWKRTGFSERAQLMKKAAQILEDNIEEYATLMTKEMGKPISGSKSEVKKCAWVCNYYSENAGKFLENEFIETDASKSFVTFQPLGVVLAVMPWNFPLWQVFRFAAPGLMAGNAGVLKHASNVPGCALAIEDVFRKAGFPENLFRALLIRNKQVKAVIENPVVQAATLTGSTPAGRAVASQSGQMLKKTVLELGGSDPYLILEDADVEDTVSTCVKSRLINSGQSCIAAKRFIVVEPLVKDFEELFVEKMRNAVVGDPFDEKTVVGPMARVDLRDELHQQVLTSVEKGTRTLLGGEKPQSKGAFYPPSVLTDVKKGTPAYEEELFGPVASIIPVKDEEEGIFIANDTTFGLGAAVFTKDVARGERIASEELEAGCCFVNSFVKSDPRLPFGGVKESGYGRELSYYGIKEFVNIKTVYVS